jgi:iodotyrosine deiodinase
MNESVFLPLSTFESYSEAEMCERAASFRQEMARRRSVRFFSQKAVPRSMIEDCLKAAATAPSGANMQPWRFVAVSTPDVKHQIRLAAEAEEQEFYHHRAPQEWLDALRPLGTDRHKPYLDDAPYLIAVFAESYGELPDGRKVKNYYAAESVGIATGMLITAIHHAGLCCLTHTPSPMNFLNDVLNRPKNERPFLLLVVGYPADDAVVPDIHKKPFDQIATFIEP